MWLARCSRHARISTFRSEGGAYVLSQEFIEEMKYEGLLNPRYAKNTSVSKDGVFLLWHALLGSV